MAEDVAAAECIVPRSSRRFSAVGLSVLCLWDGNGDLKSHGWLEGPSPPCSKVDDCDRRHVALRIGSLNAGVFWPQSPNLFWPTDQTWCVASEIDFDSTLVGGSTGPIDAILDANELDASDDDSLEYDGDTTTDRLGPLRGDEVLDTPASPLPVAPVAATRKKLVFAIRAGMRAGTVPQANAARQAIAVSTIR